MKTGLIGIKFHENATAQEIQTVISQFYKDNENFITGMQYVEFIEPSALEDVFVFIEKTFGKKDPQTKLV